MQSVRVAYEALSYVWGKPSSRHLISCNNKEFAIGQNLETALRRLRSNSVARVVWIDAICINQDDLDERSSQLQIMGDIYSQAQDVVIWLGDDDGSLPITIPLLQKVAKYAREEPEIDAQNRKEKEILNVMSVMRKADLLSVPTSAWDALVELYDREWFSRVVS